MTMARTCVPSGSRPGHTLNWPPFFASSITLPYPYKVMKNKLYFTTLYYNVNLAAWCPTIHWGGGSWW